MTRVKIVTLSAAVALVLAVMCSLVSFEAGCENIRESVLRLHVLANSDSDEDQALKLKVRDAVLEAGGGVFADSTDLATAEATAEDNLERFAAAARETVASEGYNYPVSVSLTPTEFNTRVYDNVTLPAGEYDALRVVIGDGAGHNWWCVMFPPLCLPSAEKTDLSDSLSGESLEITSESEKYTVRFKIVELYNQIKSRFDKQK